MREHRDDHQADDLTSEFWGDAPGWRTPGSTPAVDATGPLARLRRDATGAIPRTRRDATGSVARTRRDATGSVARTRRHHDPATVDAEIPPAGDRPQPRSTGSGPTMRSDEGTVHLGALVQDVIERDETVSEPRRHATGSTSQLDSHARRDATGSEPELEPQPHGRRRSRGADRRSGREGAGTGVAFGAVDPFLVRLGVIVAVGVLLVPLAFAFRSGGDEGAVRSPSAVASGGPALGRDRAVAVEPGALTGDRFASDDSGDGATDAAGAGSGQAATEAGVASAAAAEPCDLTYEIHSGDFWIRLADEAGVPLADLLRRNAATVETPLYPGEEICLPDGATRPAPPTTTTAPPAPATTAAPSASASGSNGSDSSTGSVTNRAPSAPATPRPTTTAAPTTAAPTTAAPTTTAAPRRQPSNESAAQVEAIIREIWPADQHEMALKVAHRESRMRPDAYNGHCCYGIFQIYWSVHRSWLGQFGVTSSADLLDARTNITVAYELYQRSGGWGPWRQTAY